MEDSAPVPDSLPVEASGAPLDDDSSEAAPVLDSPEDPPVEPPEDDPDDSSATPVELDSLPLEEDDDSPPVDDSPVVPPEDSVSSVVLPVEVVPVVPVVPAVPPQS